MDGTDHRILAELMADARIPAVMSGHNPCEINTQKWRYSTM